jgi:hypothetical protein
MSEDCIKRNYEGKEGFLKNPRYKERLLILRRFIGNDKPSIDLGSGGFMPKFFEVTHACDDNFLSMELLVKEGWNGDFEIVNLEHTLPYSGKQFKVAICSEVIEHFKTKEGVINLFNEIDRIAERWIVTTPAAFIPDKDHNFWFSPYDLFDLIKLPKDKFLVVRKGIYYYISNDILKLRRLCNVK